MKPNALFLAPPDVVERIYGPQQRQQIESLVNLRSPPLPVEETLARQDLLEQVEVIFSGWGAPKLDEPTLARMPRLRAFFYGAGSIRSFVTDAFWRRNIPICSAWAANALPVAEYTLGAILLSLKHVFWYERKVRELRAYPGPRHIVGGYRSVIGIISLGMIGRRVSELLRPFELEVIAHDPFVDPARAAELGVKRLVDLPTLFAEADIVSLHTPWLKETEGLITGELLSRMKPDATFINTSRGAVVREQEMIDVLTRRPDLTAILDVTYPEPPAADSPLFTLPNVVLTPHIAGSVGAECHRMGQYMIDELRRFLAGEKLQWQVTREMAEKMA
jgi:phosphoglycerate dehydrogenase-like enzyme